MSTNEFDRLIAKSVSRVSYEYDARDWEQLSMQLAVERRKKRAIVFAYVSSGIAASVAIFLISLVLTLSEKDTTGSPQYASRPQTHQPSSIVTPSVNSGVNMQLRDIQHSGNYNASAIIVHRKQIHPAIDTVAVNAAIVVHSELPQNTLPTPPKKQIDTLDFEQKHRQHGYEEPISLSYAEEENKPDHRRINVSAAAGMNYGTMNTEYVIGAAVDKKLGKKFGVEVIVAYVGNPTSIPGSQYHTPPGGVYLPPIKPISVVTSPLNYLQFAPLADYSISKKITFSAGADVQRLLQEQGVNVLYNDNIKVAPAIDLGMLLRAEYTMFSHLKAGLSYRLGANNIVAPGNNYLDRNYMQVQLKYRLR